jgi:hypothetical protein
VAGKIIVDTLDTDNSFITLNVQQATVATMNANGIFSRTGTKMIGTDGSIGNSSISGATVSGNLNFDATGTTGIRLPAANTLSFHTTGTEDMRINSSGDVGIGTTSPTAKLEVIGSSEAATSIFRVGANGNGGIIWRSANNTSVGYIQVNSDNVEYRSTNGSAGAYLQKSGISFPATQFSSADANTLDDYEEGTFTPAFQAQTGTLGSITYENRSGKYTKVGNVVYFSLQFYTSAFAAGSASGDLYIGGLPFTVASATQSSIYLGDVRLWNTDNPNAGYVQNSNNYLGILYRTTANGEVAWLNVTDARTANPGNVIGISGFYFV